MPTPHARTKRVPKLDRQRQKEDVKLLFFTGNHTLREAARLVGVSEDSACKWSAQGRWTSELQRIKTIAQSAQPRQPAERSLASREAKGSTAAAVAFDLAKVNRETRHSLSRAISRTAKHLDEVSKATPEMLFVAGDKVKAIVASAAQVAGNWDEQTGHRFAVSLDINARLQSGAFTEIPPDAICIEEETGKILFQP